MAAVRRLLLIRFLRRWASGRLHVRRGHQALRRGDGAGAVRCFARASRCRPRDLAVLLRLAVACMAAGDRERARWTLARARLLDPARFAREAPGWFAKEGLDPVLLAGLLARGEGGRAAPRPAKRPVALGPRAVPAALPWGDCRDLDEYARFRAMPPISASERESVDWEEVLADLLED